MSMMLIQDTRPKFVKRSVALLLALSALTMTACVSNISSQVKESNKDQTGAFDGTWVANVQKSAGRQSMPGNWVANCDGSAWDFRVRVADGVAKNSIRGSRESTFVSPTGDFRFDIPVKHEAKASAGSARDLALAKQTMVVYGNLKKAKGRFTYGIAEFGNNGCTAIIEFKKAGA